MTYRGGFDFKENTMTAPSRLIAGMALAMALGGNALAAPASSGAPAHWITSWYAAPQPGWDDSFVLPMNVPAWLERQTVHETVRLSAGGERIRLVLSNRYGRQPVQVGSVQVGTPDGRQPARPLTFSGRTAVTIAPARA